MTLLVDLWLPILLSAVFVFLVSSVIHMALPIHRGDFQKLPNEDAVLAALQKAGVGRGQFMFPCPASMKDCDTPVMKEKFARGPVGSIIVRQPGGGMGIGKALGIWFVYCLIVGTFVAYLAGHALPHGAAAGKVVQMTGAAAFLAHAFAQWHDWTWKGLSFGVMVKFVIDGAIYAAVTAATFAWLWPAAS